MKINTKQYAEALYQALAAAPAPQAKTIVRKFVELLGRRHIQSFMPQIIRDFSKIFNQSEHIIEAQVTTATPWTEQQAKELGKELGKATNQTVTVTTKVDPSIIGGLILQIDDVRIDGSLRNRVAHLKNSIVEN